MALWRKSSPASSCLTRNAPPMRCPATGGKWPRNSASQPVYTPSDVRAATSVELRASKCATKMDGPNIYSCILHQHQKASGSDYTLSQSECVCGSPAVRARTSWDYYWLAAQHRQGSIWGGGPKLAREVLIQKTVPLH
ncbi:hypothetical protein ATANTOWER_013832 [Ataeniobius toweri]|uniref:Uncharacterized protein n=1 Tax=Ataeniobius toweri TaxID=208326 RepID=A0ABU7BGL4_9TELE|nr:hypothetical protein [Ataeniobius toweri]